MQEIKHQENLKLLGITITQDLSYNKHLVEGNESVVTKIHKKIGLVRMIRPYTTKKNLTNIAGALVNSTIAYGAPIWGQSTTKVLDKVQKAQMRVARIVVNEKPKRGTRKKRHRQDAMDKLGWSNVKQIVEKTTLNLTKKAIEGESSKGLNELFEKRVPKHQRGDDQMRIGLKN